MTIVTVGIDLAKNIFAVHGMDEYYKPVWVRLEVPRAKLVELIANVPPCLIGTEAALRVSLLCVSNPLMTRALCVIIHL